MGAQMGMFLTSHLESPFAHFPPTHTSQHDACNGLVILAYWGGQAFKYSHAFFYLYNLN